MELGAMALIAIIGTIFQFVANRFAAGDEYEKQNQLLTREQDFTREREDLAYERSRPETQFQNFLDAGFNAPLAANAVLGGNGQQVSATGSPIAPNVNSAMSTLQSMFGQGEQNLYDMFFKDIEAKNIQANTNKTEIEAGLLPRDFELRKMSTESQIGLWNASVEKIAKENDLLDEEKDLVRQQNMFYGRMAEAELEVKRQTAAKLVEEAKLASEQAKTQSHVRNELDARAALEGEQKNTEIAKQGMFNQQEQLFEAEAGETRTENEMKRFDLTWIEQHNVPLTVDAQKYLVGLLNNGEFDKADKFLQSVFATAQNQEYGKNIGSRRDFKIGSFTIPEGRYYSPVFSGFGSPTPSHIPYWNPN